MVRYARRSGYIFKITFIIPEKSERHPFAGQYEVEPSVVVEITENDITNQPRTTQLPCYLRRYIRELYLTIPGVVP
ncbi:hypothetical protein D3C86_2147010 [compost metagenome]